MGNLFDEAKVENTRQQNEKEIKCANYISRLEKYKSVMWNAIDENIDQMIVHRYNEKSFFDYDALSEYRLFGEKYTVREFLNHEWYTDGKHLFRKEYKGNLRLYKKAFVTYKMLKRDEMIGKIIEDFFWFFDDMDYDNHKTGGVILAIEYLNRGETNYSIHKYDLFSCIDEYIAVSAEVRVKEWIKKNI